MPKELRNVRLGELSLVKRGANQGARVVLIKTADFPDAEYCKLIKRDFTAEERQAAADAGEAMPDGSFPIKTVSDLKNAIHAVGRAKNPDAVKAHIKRRARALGATDELPDDWSKSFSLAKALVYLAKQEEDDGALSTFADELAEIEGYQEVCQLLGVLQQNLFDITSDDDATADDKVSAMGVSVGQFLSTLRERFPDAEVELSKLLTENPATAGFFDAGSSGDLSGKEGFMPDDLKKQLDDVSKKLAELTKQHEEQRKQLEKASMSDEHKAYMAQLPQEKRGDFADLSATDRSAYMQKNPIKKAEDEEVFKIGEVTIKKSAVGADMFAVVKSQHETIAALSADLRKAEDARSEVELIAKAKADYPNVPGDPGDKAKLLKALEKVDPKVKETAEKIMAFANKAASDRLTEIGSGGDVVVGTAEQELTKLAKSYAEENKVDFAKAYDHVLSAHPALYQKYLEEKRKAA